VAMTTPTSMQHVMFWPIYVALHNKLFATRGHPSAHWHSAIRAFLFLSFKQMIVMVLTSALPSPSLDSSPVWLRVQSVMVLSSTEAELIALTDAVHQAVYMRKLYNMLNLPSHS